MTAPTLANSGIPVTPLYDPTGHQDNVAWQSGTVTQDANTGVKYAPGVNDLWINQMIKNGQGFSYSSPSGTTTGAASISVCALSVFNPANSGKNIFLYSLMPFAAANESPASIKLRKITADPSGTTGFTNTFSGVNHNLGSAIASAASLCSSANAIAVGITETGTVIVLPPLIGNAESDLLNGSAFLLSPGSGLELNIFVVTSGNNFGAWAKGIEF